MAAAELLRADGSPRPVDWPVLTTDTREPEGHRWELVGVPFARRIARLDCADYAIESWQLSFERKTGPDFIAAIGRARGRVERMVGRWTGDRWWIIECSMPAVIFEIEANSRGPRRLTPAHVHGFVRSLLERGVKVVFAADKSDAQLFVCNVIRAAARRRGITWRES